MIKILAYFFKIEFLISYYHTTYIFQTYKLIKMATRIKSNVDYIISKLTTEYHSKEQVDDYIQKIDQIITELQNIIHQISPYNNAQSIKGISELNDVISYINNMKSQQFLIN